MYCALYIVMIAIVMVASLWLQVVCIVNNNFVVNTKASK